MKQLSVESKEFKRVLHNLHLENIHLAKSIQRKIVESTNQKGELTPALIKEMLANDKI